MAKNKAERTPANDVVDKFLKEQGISLAVSQPRTFIDKEGVLRFLNPIIQAQYTDEIGNGEANLTTN